MKALSIRISAGMMALGALFYFLACAPAPQDNRQNQNLAPNQNEANENVAAKALDPCRDYGADPGGTHAQKLKKGIKDKMSGKLKRLLKDQENPNGTFTIDIEKGSNVRYFVAYINGEVSGDDGLKELSNILNDFQDEDECLRVAYFVVNQTSTSTLRQAALKWSSCQYPMVVCPGGECCYPNTNSNTGNMNTNSNTGNSNTNANIP